MKQTYKYIALALLILGFAACSQEDIVPQDEQKDTPITIQTAGVAELTTRAVANGRLVGTEDAPVEIGVFVTGGSADEYNCFNAKYTHNGTSWTGETVLYEGIGSAQQIYAYYPYTEIEDVNGTVAVTASEQKDYLVATPTSLTSSTVSLTMSHALTKLMLEVTTTGTEIASDETIAKVEVQNMYASGTWKVSDNSWSDLSEANATLEMTDNEVLIIPMVPCDPFPVVVTTNKGRVLKTVVDLRMVENELCPGTAYTIKLKVGRDKVELGGISSTSWETEVGGQLGTE